MMESNLSPLPTKVRLVKAMVFPVVTYGCESWTVKKAECRRIDAFQLWFWRRLLRIPCTARRCNQSFLKEIDPGCSLERMMLKLKLQYFGPHAKSWLIGKESDAGRDWGQKKGTTEDEMAVWHHWLDGHEFEWTPGVGDGQGAPVCYNSWGCKESDTTEWLNWTELILKSDIEKGTWTHCSSISITKFSQRQNCRGSCLVTCITDSASWAKDGLLG